MMMMTMTKHAPMYINVIQHIDNNIKLHENSNKRIFPHPVKYAGKNFVSINYMRIYTSSMFKNSTQLYNYSTTGKRQLQNAQVEKETRDTL